MLMGFSPWNPQRKLLKKATPITSSNSKLLAPLHVQARPLRTWTLFFPVSYVRGAILVM